MAKNKMTNRQIIAQKTQHRKLKTKQQTPPKTCGDLRCPGMRLLIHSFRTVQLTPTITFQQGFFKMPNETFQLLTYYHKVFI